MSFATLALLLLWQPHMSTTQVWILPRSYMGLNKSYSWALWTENEKFWLPCVCSVGEGRGSTTTWNGYAALIQTSTISKSVDLPVMWRNAKPKSRTSDQTSKIRAQTLGSQNLSETCGQPWLMVTMKSPRTTNLKGWVFKTCSWSASSFTSCAWMME